MGVRGLRPRRVQGSALCFIFQIPRHFRPVQQLVDPRRLFQRLIGQEFQRNEAAKLDVFGFVDYAHAATTKLFDHSIVRDGLSDHCGILRG